MRSIRVFICGVGNEGRRDDALGILCVRALACPLNEQSYCSFRFETAPQFNVEHAQLLSECELAILVDASTEEIESYSFTKVETVKESTFQTHALSPAGVLALCNQVYGRSPETYLLAIKGYEWDFGEELSEQASKNLESAEQFLTDFLAQYR